MGEALFQGVAVQDALRPVLVVISFVHGPCLPNGTVCSFLYGTRLPSNGSLASNWLRLCGWWSTWLQVPHLRETLFFHHRMHRWRLPGKRVHNHLRLRLHYAWLPRRGALPTILQSGWVLVASHNRRSRISAALCTWSTGSGGACRTRGHKQHCCSEMDGTKEFTRRAARSTVDNIRIACELSISPWTLT